jgi:hypothetical protein
MKILELVQRYEIVEHTMNVLSFVCGGLVVYVLLRHSPSSFGRFKYLMINVTVSYFKPKLNCTVLDKRNAVHDLCILHCPTNTAISILFLYLFWPRPLFGTGRLPIFHDDLCIYARVSTCFATYLLYLPILADCPQLDWTSVVQKCDISADFRL